MRPTLCRRPEEGRDLPFLTWRFDRPQLAIASGTLGGGIGLRHWVLNATVVDGYERMDPDRHLQELADREALTGPGVGLMTAVDVIHRQIVSDEDVDAVATVGIREPLWAAVAPDHPTAVDHHAVGTINVVAFVPVRLTEAALVNAVATITEAKAQAFVDAGLAGTGTATDAVCVVCPPDGPAEPFGGPRSRWGSAIARATHRAVVDGVRAQDEWRAANPSESW